jgi:hypothetical protein
MAIIAISSIMILMASALRWKEPSIQREIELIHRQHSFQSRLVSEMTIPMPFPITGGSLLEHQVKEKRLPFMASRRNMYRGGDEHGLEGDVKSSSGGKWPSAPKADERLGSPLGSPRYCEGRHEYHQSSQLEEYIFTDDPDVVYMREFQSQQQQEKEEYYRSEFSGVAEQNSLGHVHGHGQSKNYQTSASLSAKSTSTATSSSATATSYIPSPSLRSISSAIANTQCYSRHHPTISGLTSGSISGSEPASSPPLLLEEVEQQLQALKAQRAALNHSDDTIISTPILPSPSLLLSQLSPPPEAWNSRSPITTPRWMYYYDVPPPPSYPILPFPSSLSTVGESTSEGGNRGIETTSSECATTEMQQYGHGHHYPTSSSTATGTTTCTTIQHTLQRR